MGDMAEFLILSEELTRYEEPDFPMSADEDYICRKRYCNCSSCRSSYRSRYRTPYNPRITRADIEEAQDNEATRNCIKAWKNKV